MKFYKLEEVPVDRGDQVFRVSSTGKAFAAVLLLGIAIACLVMAVTGLKPVRLPTPVCYFIAAFAGLFPLVAWRASRKPTSWLMRCNPTGLIIKYSSYLNWKLGETGPQAVGIDYSEISWVKLVKETRTKPSMDGHSETSFLTYIELGLVNPDTSQLEQHLSADRNFRPQGKAIFNDYPVQMLNGVVQVRWTGGIKPSAHKAIEFLGRRVRTLDAEHRKTDLCHQANATPDQERAKIVALAKSGDKIAAATLARRVYGYDLTKATEFVEKILQEG